MAGMSGGYSPGPVPLPGPSTMAQPSLHRIEAMMESMLDSQSDLLSSVRTVQATVQDMRGAFDDCYGGMGALPVSAPSNLTVLSNSQGGGSDRDPRLSTQESIAFLNANIDNGARSSMAGSAALLAGAAAKRVAFACSNNNHDDTGSEAGGYKTPMYESVSTVRTQPGVVEPFMRRVSNGGAPVAPSTCEKTLSPNTMDGEDGKDDVFLAPMLPRGWPRTMELRDGFPTLHAEAESSHARNNPDSAAFARRLSSAAAAPAALLDVSDVNSADAHRSKCIQDPDSWLPTIHNITGIWVLIFDLTLVPFVMAWDVNMTGSISAYAFASACYWAWDVLVNCFTGFYDKGRVVMKRRKILKHYFQTWAPLDLLTCFTDWLSVVVTLVTEGDNDAGGFVRLVRFMKLGRFLRVVGAIRIMKFQSVVREVADRQLSETWRFVNKIFNFAIIFLWCNHLLTCLWYAVGKDHPSESSISWLDRDAGGISGTYREASMTYQYFAAFHWSLAQITLGATDIYSITTFERAINILYLLLGLLVTTTLVSSLSASMVDLQISQKDKKDKMRTLRTFLRDNSVNSRLATCVQQQVIDRLSTRGRLRLKDVDVLSMCTPTLQMELRFEISRLHLMRFPLFRLWISLDSRTVQNFFMGPVESIHIRPKDDIFLAGAAGESAYVLISGGVSYTQDPSSSPCTDTTVHDVPVGQIMGEACLWTKWIHVGTACSLDVCELLRVSADGLMQALQKHGIIREITVEYGNYFHQRLRLAQPPGASWPDDLRVPFTDFGDIVRSMSIDVQATIGFDALRYITKGSAGTISKLRDEIAAGKCVVIVDGLGEVRRCVSLVTLSVEHEDGSIFYQVGKLNALDGSVDSSCQLPGSKFEWRETIEEAIPRILHMKIGCFERLCNLLKVEQEVQDTTSQAYGVATTYLRVVCHLELEPNAMCPAWKATSGSVFWETQDFAFATKGDNRDSGNHGSAQFNFRRPASGTAEQSSRSIAATDISKSSKQSPDPTRSSRTAQGQFEPTKSFGLMRSRPSAFLNQTNWNSESRLETIAFCEELRDKDVFVVKENVQGKKAYNLYTWLLPTEVELLKGTYAYLLKPWLQSLNIPLSLEESC